MTSENNRRALLRAEGEERKSHRHATNPFTDTWAPETTLKHRRMDLDKRPPIYDAEGAQVKGVLLWDTERDGERFIKLVREEMSGLGQLSKTARLVLDFAMYQLLPQNAIVWLPPMEAKAFCCFRQGKSFYDGINELLIYEFLARTEKQGFYFANPRKFFNGNRQNIRNLFNKPRPKPLT